jgi:hypothetical protein
VLVNRARQFQNLVVKRRAFGCEFSRDMKVVVASAWICLRVVKIADWEG